MTEIKLLIAIPHYNDSHFLPLQILSFNKYIKNCTWKVLVLDDSTNTTLNSLTKQKENLKKICDDYSEIIYHKIPQSIHVGANLGTVRHPEVLNYLFKTVLCKHKHNYDYLLVFDADMCMIKPFDVPQIVENYDIIGQKRIQWLGKIQCDPNTKTLEYFWIHCCFYNLNTIKNIHNIDMSVIPNTTCDTGSMIVDFLIDNPQYKLKHYETRMGEIIEPDNFEYFYDYMIIHFRTGSLWDGGHNYPTHELYKIKFNLMIKYVNNGLSEDQELILRATDEKQWGSIRKKYAPLTFNKCTNIEFKKFINKPFIDKTKSKILIYNHGHAKLLKNLIKSLQINSYNVTVLPYNVANIQEHIINKFDIVYSSCVLLNMDKHPNTKFIFGPQLGVIPSHVVEHVRGTISCKHSNGIFITPGIWTMQKWTELGWNQLPISYYPVGVDTDYFAPLVDKAHTTQLSFLQRFEQFQNISDISKITFISSDVNNKINNNVLIYIKQRANEDVNYIINYLKQYPQYILHIFIYGKYSEIKFREAAQQCSFGIWIGQHESQGFAVEEALSCGLPLLVWEVTTVDQEVDIPWSKGIPEHIKKLATTIPYWDERCGETFINKEEFENKFNIIRKNLYLYKPRDYILENLSLEKQGKEFLNLV